MKTSLFCDVVAEIPPNPAEKIGFPSKRSLATAEAISPSRAGSTRERISSTDVEAKEDACGHPSLQREFSDVFFVMISTNKE